MAALPSLRQLSYLVTLSETLHFTEAARRSFVTQSTLSGGIMELERLLGGVLVERDRQNVRLTPLGEQVVARARVLLADAQDLMRLSREMSEPLTGDLHLGIIPTIAPFILTRLLDEVHQQLPKIQLHLHEAQSEKIVEKLEHGNLDMIVLALPFDTRGLKVAEITKENLFVVYNKNDKNEKILYVVGESKPEDPETISDQIISELLKEKIIKSTENLSFKLTTSKLIVNEKEISETVQKKLKKYLPKGITATYYNYNLSNEN